MYTEELAKIGVRLPVTLETELSSADAAEFVRLWSTGTELLAERSKSKRDFFRDALLLIIKLNKRFAVSGQTGNRVRRIVLDAFLERGGYSENNSVGSYSEFNSQMSQQSISRLSTPPEHTAKHHVFETLLSTLGELYDTRLDLEGAFKRELEAKASQLTISSRSRMVLERWSTTDEFRGSFDRMSEEDMRAVVDLVYTTYCDIWGPAIADSMISDATTKVESMPEARQFPPRSIL